MNVLCTMYIKLDNREQRQQIHSVRQYVSVFSKTICICIQLENMYMYSVRQYVSVFSKTICICIQ